MRWGPRGWSSTIIHLKRQTTHCIHFDDVIYHSLIYKGWKNQVITSQLICEKVKFDGKNLFKVKEISGTRIPSCKISIIMISYRVWVEKIKKYFLRNWFHGKNYFFFREIDFTEKIKMFFFVKLRSYLMIWTRTHFFPQSDSRWLHQICM